MPTTPDSTPLTPPPKNGQGADASRGSILSEGGATEPHSTRAPGPFWINEEEDGTYLMAGDAMAGDEVVTLARIIDASQADMDVLAAAHNMLATLLRLSALVDIMQHREYETVEDWAAADEKLASNMDALIHNSLAEAITNEEERLRMDREAALTPQEDGDDEASERADQELASMVQKGTDHGAKAVLGKLDALIIKGDEPDERSPVHDD